MTLTSNSFSSIQVKLILFIVIPIIFFFILGLFFTISKISTSTEEQLSKNVIIQAKNYAAILESEFNAIASLARVNAGMLENNASLSEDLLLSVLKNTLLSKTQIYGVGVIFEKEIDEKSSIYFYKTSDGEVSPLVINESRHLKKEYWYLETKIADAPNWSEPYIAEVLGKNIIATVAVPFHLKDKFAGVSFIDIDLTKLQKHSGLETLTDNAFVITSKKGRFITHPNPELIMTKTLQDVSREINDPGLVLLNKEVREGKSGQVRVEKLSIDIDEPYWLFYAPIRSTGWGFETGLPEREVLAFAKMQTQRAVFGISIILVLAIICVLVVSNSLTRPLKILTDAVQQLADGDLTTSITAITTKDEIGQLSQAFNNMTLQLRQHVVELNKQYATRANVENELTIARSIQSTLIPNKFPAFPDYDEFDLHGLSHAASHVAGDFFDFFLLDSCRLFIVIADVSGKGVGPALLMAVSRTHIRNLAAKGHSPAQILTELNELMIHDREQPMFVTVFVAEYNISSGDLCYANGGHVAPYLITKDGLVTQFGGPTGTIVGMLEDAEFGEETIKLKKDETIVLYTDGILEARIPDGEFFGEQHFETLLSANAEMSLSELCDSALATVKAYQANKLSDDVTVLALRKLN
jgi:sigma-B regulation protein RsbU (phosphoserine phosphatase)